MSGIFDDFTDDAVESRRQTAANMNLHFGVATDPDQAARRERLAQRFSLPPALVQEYQPEYEQRAKLEDARAAVSSAPTLRNWLAAEVKRAELTHDDVDNLARVEHSINTLRAPEGPQPSIGSVVSGLFKALPRGLEKTRQGIRMQFADLIGSDDMQADAMRKRAHADMDQVLTDPVFESDTARGLYGGGVSLIQQTPGLLASILLRSPTPMLASAGVNTQAEAYGKYRARGATAGEAFIGATGEGAVEVGTEMIPMGFLVNKFGKVGAGEFLKGFLGRELATEQLATVLQDAIDTSVANPDKTWGEYLQERPDAAYQTFLGTLVQSGAIGALHTGARYVEQRAERAQQTRDNLAAVVQAVGTTKLRERDADALRDLIANAEGGDVFLDGRSLAQTFQQSGLDPAQLMPSAAEQIGMTAETGGMVAVPVGEFATALAAQPKLESLLDQARLDPRDESPAEVRTWQEQHGEGFMNEVAQAVQAQATAVTDTGAQAVYENILGQLNQAGRFTDNVNQAYAVLLRDFFGTLASRTGMRIEQLAAQYAPRIVNEGFGAYAQPARGSFDPQTRTIALLKSADLSTFLHESGHFFFEVMADVAQQSNQAQIGGDLQAMLTWMNVPDLATWNGMTLEEKRPHHEQFARGFEAYLFEGKAPSIEMESVFQRFRAWLVNVYRSLSALNVELNDEVRGVFGRLLATDQQIAEAGQLRGAMPMFKTKPDTMTEMEWLAYQAMGDESQNQALAGFQARRLKDIAARRTAEGKQLFREVRRQVSEEVMRRPVFAARQYLMHGTLPDGTKAGEPVKLSLPALKALYGEGAEAPWRQLPFGQYGLASQIGVHPDVIAEQFGFPSGDALVRTLATAPKPAEVIQAEAEQRFAEEHGDAYTPEGIRNAAEEEFANESRSQQLTAELNALRRSIGQTQIIHKAAKDYASRAVASMPVKRARQVQTHAAAETRAGKLAENALTTGDMRTAASAKRDQVLNHQLARVSREVRAEIDAFIERTRRYFVSDAKLAKSRDMDLVNAARAILASYGLGTADKSAAAYIESIKQNDPETYADIEPMVADALMNPKDYRDMTLDAFRGMVDTVESLWHLSRRTRQIEIDGKLVDREEVTAGLSSRIRELGQPHANLGYSEALTTWQESKFSLLGIRAALRRVESWVTAMDDGKAGPFRTFLWNPIADAVNRYRDAKREHLQRYLDIVKGVEKGLTAGKIAAPELGYTFRDKAELLHAMLHTGNESNMGKLMRGRNWGDYRDDGTVNTRRWDAFIRRAAREGIVSRADYEFAQGVWDLLESMKPAAQKAHKDMYGFYFDEITAQSVITPFGDFRGGYVPAIADPAIVTDAAVHREKETVLGGNNSFMFPSTGRGFTKGRVEAYAKPLLLDLGYLPAHIDKVLRFTHVEPRIKDVARIVKNAKGFGATMDALDPTARTDMLIPWLQRTATQRVETPSIGRAGRAADTFFRELRKRTGLQIMTANVVNAMQQITGLSSALVKVPPRYLRNALWQYAKQPGTTAEAIADKSAFMRNRITAQTMEVQQSIDELLLNPSKYEQARAFAQRHGYFLQAGFQNVVDTITWQAAYEQAIEEGTNETEAVRRSDAAVRETQGSFAPEDISRFESGAPFVRAFTMFYSYFNTQANLLGTELANVANGIGLKAGAGRVLYLYVFGFMIPAVLAETIVRAMGAGFDDDQDGDIELSEVFAMFFGAQGRFVAGMAPGIGPGIMAGVNAFNDKWYDDRISTSPAVSTIESTVRAPHSIYKALAGDGSDKRAIRDTLTAVGMLTGLPVAPLGRPLGYLADMQEGKASPENGADLARGLITGRQPRD